MFQRNTAKSMASNRALSLVLASFAGHQLLTKKNMKAECASKAEEEAAELEKILQSQNGGMPVDPEEMQALLSQARNKGSPKPPAF